MFDSFSKFAGRKAVLATAAVVALTAVAPTASYAGGRHWHHGGGGAAAAAAMFGLAASTAKYSRSSESLMPSKLA